ncbi:arylesterase [Echinicola marina]|uniref:arylesterase n=1 Tax=Echinicola marina TaxID=2859768 RepID=UPI001CF70C11|nr:arylesterase [Echinicola marina]UCS94943.1 arylesterase [Echinicola marina]
MTKTSILKSILSLSIIGIFFSACSTDQKQASDEKEEARLTDSAAQEEKKKTILFFGDSMTAGYGVDQSQAFPALVQDKIDSLGLNYKVINGGLSGETSASGLSRIDWFLEEQPDIFILELGGNDGLRGIQLDETKKNLQGIIDKIEEKYPDTRVILAGMQIPPNMGQEYTAEFQKMYPEIAEKNDLVLIPFLLEGVGGNAALNQPDGIHPTAEGHQLVAKNVWEFLGPVL